MFQGKTSVRAAQMFTDFYQAWWFLYNHPIFDDTPKKMMLEEETIPGTFSRFEDCLDVDIVKVNPKTNRIDDDDKLNTETRVWLECGPWVHRDREMSQESRDRGCYDFFPEGRSHDWHLDCGGRTYEEAIVKLANLVFQHYDTAIWPWYSGKMSSHFAINEPEPLPEPDEDLTLHELF